MQTRTPHDRSSSSRLQIPSQNTSPGLFQKNIRRRLYQANFWRQKMKTKKNCIKSHSLANYWKMSPTRQNAKLLRLRLGRHFPIFPLKNRNLPSEHQSTYGISQILWNLSRLSTSGFSFDDEHLMRAHRAQQIVFERKNRKASSRVVNRHLLLLKFRRRLLLLQSTQTTFTRMTWVNFTQSTT